MKHVAQIQQEFLKLAMAWEDLPHDLQKAYLSRHPLSRRRLTSAPPRKSPTSGLKIYEPKRSQSHGILNSMRAAISAVAGSGVAADKPIWRKYLTMTDERHNKYHYFGVFPSKDSGFVAANVFGRIGYPPKGVAIIATAEKADDAIRSAEYKLNKKMKKGYTPTSLPASSQEELPKPRDYSIR
jgi:predicted DNA-binding WGR domain protein